MVTKLNHEESKESRILVSLARYELSDFQKKLFVDGNILIIFSPS